jgi:hypothetical protein
MTNVDVKRYKQTERLTEEGSWAVSRDTNLGLQVRSKQSVRLRAGLGRCEWYVTPVHDHGQTSTRAPIQYRTSSPLHNTTWITILTRKTLAIILTPVFSARLSYLSQKEVDFKIRHTQSQDFTYGPDPLHSVTRKFCSLFSHPLQFKPPLPLIHSLLP